MSLPEYGSASVTSHTVFSAVVPEPAEATIDPYFFLLWLKGLKPKEIVPLAANMTFQQFVEPAKHDESSIRVTTTLPLAAGGRARTSTLSSISASGGAHLSASSRSAILRCIQAEVRDQLHTFRMLEEFLVEPSLLQRQSLFCISSEVQQDMIAKYYSFDTSFMRLMLGRKPSSKIRKELDDISEKTGIRSSSCQRQMENLRRVDHACEMTDALAQAAGAPTGSLNASERSLTPKRTSVASDSAMALPDPSFSLSASSLGTTGMQSGTIGRGFKWSVRGSILSAPGATGSAGAASNAHGMGVRKPVSASVRRANLQAKQIHLAQRQDDEALGAFISRVFCLPLGLALRYARLVFLARYRLDTLQKKLLSLSYEDFDELTDLIMREWGLPSPQEDNLDFKFLEDLKTLKTDLCSDGNTMSEYAAVVSHLLANQVAQQPQSKPELRAQKLSKLNLSRFSSIVKALVAVAVELTRRGELRDLFVDINDSVVHLFSRLGWTRAESDALLVMLARGAGELQALRDKPRVVQLWARYLRVVRPVAVLLLERSLAPKSRQSVMRKQGRASEVDVTPPVSAFVQEYVGERKEVSALDRDSAHPSTDTLGAEDTHGHRMTYGRWLLPEQLPSAMQSDDDAEFDDVRHDFQEAVRDVSAGGFENEARQFDIAASKAQQQVQILGTDNQCTALRCRHREGAMASMANDSTLDPSLARSFRGHEGPVNAVSFNPNMKQVASGGDDRTVMVWNFKPQLRAFRYVGHKGAVHDVNFSPTGHCVASASADNTIRLWVPTVAGHFSSVKAHSAAVRSVRWSRDGKFLLSASNDKTCKVWQVRPGATPQPTFGCTLSGHINWVNSADFNPDMRMAVSGSDDKTVKIWDVERATVLHTFYEHEGPVNTVRFHPAGRVVASGGDDCSVKLWDIRTNKLIQHYPAHTSPVTCLAFHPTGVLPSGHPSSDFLLSSSCDSLLKIWDLKEGHQLYTIHGHRSSTRGVCFSPKGRWFASCGDDGLVMTWKTNFDQEIDKPSHVAGRAPRPSTAPPREPHAAAEAQRPRTGSPSKKKIQSTLQTRRSQRPQQPQPQPQPQQHSVEQKSPARGWPAQLRTGAPVEAKSKQVTNAAPAQQQSQFGASGSAAVSMRVMEVMEAMTGQLSAIAGALDKFEKRLSRSEQRLTAMEQESRLRKEG